ncbi:putative protein kinase-like protein [Trypanosoma cruzi Dm28c]|uniref:Uncharacterized protein n=1 Tax=Trypanosoma cruzi Dm28c TaxID=1416333 RepID=V5DCE6_TRYCR|nr:putative protein kinase-like protein [Trypanosoma cruzi Dm28c]
MLKKGARLHYDTCSFFFLLFLFFHVSFMICLTGLPFFFFLLSFLWIFYLLCFFMCHGVEVYIYMCVFVCAFVLCGEWGFADGMRRRSKKSGRENAMVRGNRAERHRSTAVLFFVAFFSFSGVVEVSHYYPMDVSVVLAADVLSSSDTRHALILVGQRSVAGGSGNQERAVCIVSDAIPCTDMDVIMEQVECLEQVLPCGIAFLGVFLPGDGVKDLAALRHSLRSHLQVSFFLLRNTITREGCSVDFCNPEECCR